MSIKKIFIILIFLPSMSYSQDIQREIVLNKPDLKQITSAYVGESIISSAKGVYKDCIVPNFSFEKSYLSVEAGKPICKESKSKENHYMPTYANDNTRSDGAPGKRRIIFENNDGDIKFKFYRSRLSIKDLSQNDFEIGRVFIQNDNSSKKSLEYSGKKDNELRFIYFETKNLKNINEREIALNISDGNVLSYKGSLIEIISYNSTMIEYMVIKHFE
ncbi:hypothetical protein OAK06_02905 [Gammaproteobacteria bacterium]|nr:hypothetical protein [Gammaproteobacteria bacterium]